MSHGARAAKHMSLSLKVVFFTEFWRDNWDFTFLMINMFR